MSNESLMARILQQEVKGTRDLLDELDEEELKKLFVLVGIRVAERVGNLYKAGSTNATAFSALFGGAKRSVNKQLRFKQLDTSDPEGWDVEDVRDWLFRN